MDMTQRKNHFVYMITVNFEFVQIRTSDFGNRLIQNYETIGFYISCKFYSSLIVKFRFYFLTWYRDRDIFAHFQSANSGVGKPDVIG